MLVCTRVLQNTDISREVVCVVKGAWAQNVLKREEMSTNKLKNTFTKSDSQYECEKFQ
jgi:hypothetical protein